MIIGDISFRNREDLEAMKTLVGETWEDEFYWVADETIDQLRSAGCRNRYFQISPCAGVYTISLK